MRTLVQSFDETAQEQAKRDFVLFKSRFSGDFSARAARCGRQARSRAEFSGVP